jgi:hypothetical protein
VEGGGSSVIQGAVSLYACRDRVKCANEDCVLVGGDELLEKPD